MKTSKLTIAESYGLIASQEDNFCVPAQNKELMAMLSGRKIGSTPKGEPSTSELINSSNKGFNKGQDMKVAHLFV